MSNEGNINFISLRFFEPYHGQNEGDSAHSTITTALNNSGDVFVPSQLISIFRLARRKCPFIVHALDTQDFLDYKTFSKNLRILSLRKDNNGDPVNWTTMREVMVKKETPGQIFFKDSHLLKNTAH